MRARANCPLVGLYPHYLRSLPTLQYVLGRGLSVTLEVPLRTTVRYADYGGEPRRPITGRHRAALARHLMHVKIAALVQTSNWPPPLDAGATGPQSLLISSSLLCGRRHLLQRGGRSCPNEARPAPSHHSKPLALVPGWPGLGLSLARNPALRLPARCRGRFLRTSKCLLRTGHGR